VAWQLPATGAHLLLIPIPTESAAGDEVIMSIAGHVSRYSHERMAAKRRALDEIAARQRAADEEREEEAEGRKTHVATPATPVSMVANVQYEYRSVSVVRAHHCRGSRSHGATNRPVMATGSPVSHRSLSRRS
jgi:hypothetical protein